MVCFQTKNPDLGKIGRALDWKMFKYFIFQGDLGYCMTIWYIFSGFGIMYQEKSGNPDSKCHRADQATLGDPEAKKRP
jgi:hypothetical protein